jgi:NAD+ synthase
MDLCLYGRNHGVPAADVGAAIGLTADQVERIYKDIDQKRRTTRYLRLHPRLVQDVPEVDH